MFAESGEEAITPVHDVVAAYPGAHAHHTPALLLRLHGNGAVECLGDAHFIVRIDEKCAALELGCCTGKFAEDEHAIVLGA